MPHPAGVSVTLVDLTDDAALSRAETWLTSEELARARCGGPAVHRRRVLLRAALRHALAAELRVAPAEVPVSVTSLGRPYVVTSEDVQPLDVSCSASGALGVVAVARRRRIGVDVEAVAPWSSDVLDEGWLAAEERSALAGLPAGDRPIAATRCWTQKEAVLKARGVGLRGQLAATVTVVGRADGLVAGWQVHDLAVPHGWVASIAVAPDEEMPS